jgi:transposase
MPTERLSMRKVREVLRLKHVVGLSYREISEATGVGKTAVWEYIRRAEVLGITWPIPEDLDDATFERRLFAYSGAPAIERAAIDWVGVHEELKRRGVTLLLLWQEYRCRDPEGYGYSRFCPPSSESAT